MLKICCVAGARPNFIKVAALLKAFADRPGDFEVKLVHTGQHYDYSMNERFFSELGIPPPHVSLSVGSGSHAYQTAEVMKRFDAVAEETMPDCVVVVGDVNSTLACALVAAKRQIRVAHVEAGLRSGDRTMPEEINRVVTDQLSDRLYVTEQSAVSNLVSEGISREKIVFAGNVMIDTLLSNLDKVGRASAVLGERGGAALCGSDGYALLTLHRPSNVDEPARLEALLRALSVLSERWPLVFPVHPRTEARIRAAGLEWFLQRSSVLYMPPVGYFEMMALMRDARFVLTDSGGVQEETTALSIPCFTLRDNTERPITVTEGTNSLLGSEPTRIKTELIEDYLSRGRGAARPYLWDGKAACRIAADLFAWLSQ